MAAIASSARRLAPGVGLCLAIGAVATLLQWAEERLLGKPYLEALVLAILLGTALRAVWTPGSRFKPGIGFSAKFLLEVAVMLLGAALPLQQIAAAGWMLPACILVMVMAALGIGTALGLALRLPVRMALLIATGNAICGNSAIAAVAPVIGAKSEDVAAAIAFTAVLGIAVVLLLPFAIPLLHLTDPGYGMLAGATVYAVPQVLAATVPVGDAATRIGTLTKLMRVLMLGPVLLAFAALVRPRLPPEADSRGEVMAGEPPPPGLRVGFFQLVPWFIIGFAVMSLLRTFGAIPDAVLPPLQLLSNRLLTVLAMAALGLGADVRALVRVGGRVSLAVTGSLLALLVLAVLLVAVVAP